VIQDDVFRQVTIRICGTLDIKNGMRRCLQYLREVLPIDGMGFCIYDKELHAVRTIGVVGPDYYDGETDRVFPLAADARERLKAEESEFLRVTANRCGLDPVQMRIVNQKDHPLLKLVTNHFGEEDFSFLFMQLVLEGQVLGALVVRGEGEGRFTEEDAQALSVVHEPFAIALSNALKHEELQKLKDMLSEDNEYLHKELLRASGDEIIGEESGLKSAMDMVRQVAPLDSPVLLRGETGVGKDVIANAIHYSSPRNRGPFIKVNCGAIPETLIDSELFGHERGAFTGALAQKRGYFERAHKGTLFLDEVGELPPHAQVRLLRVLQYKEFERVGGAGPITVDIRVVAATHRNLEEMVREGRFREDLWFRLNVFPILVPPLRDRKEDIPVLVHHLMIKKSKQLRLHVQPSLAPGALDRLLAYHWPGNVRELENVVERALILSKGRPLDFDRLALVTEQEGEVIPASSPTALRYDDLAAAHIRRVLEMTGGKVQGPGGAAEVLGVKSSTLRNRMKKLGIPYGRSRRPSP
jgi:transcriptional regulator with GAF, ATPase, and Fis domain